MKKTNDYTDDWGVWDMEEGAWVDDFSDYSGIHKRQWINQNHAYNAADLMNGYLYATRYEARDMTANVKTVMYEDVRVKSIQELIDDRKGTIAHLQDEINALEMALMLMGGR